MKEIIKKLYARELDLIADRPVAVKQRVQYIRLLKERLWDSQSTAMKIATAALVFSFIAALVYYYNLFIVEQYKVRLERAQIEAELQRRNDLIPSLVKAVIDYMSFEGKIFQHAADVRGALNSLKNIPNEGPSALSIQSALSRFQAVAENYPDLKSSVTYQNLMKELSNTETRIAESRIKYNIAANYYNSRLRMFPGIFFGYALGFRSEKTFEAEKTAQTVPGVR